MIMTFIVVLLSVSVIASLQVYRITAQLQIEPNSSVSVDKAVYGPSQLVYVTISDPDFNLDRGVVEIIDLTQIVSGHPIVEVVIRQPSEGTVVLSAVDGSLKDRNGNVITKAVESGPNTAVFEFEITLPDNIEPNSSVTVLYHDPFALKTGPETSGSSVNNVVARLDTDKNEVSLGNDLTIILVEPDANIDSRSIDAIPFSAILISSDKFDETPLDKVIDTTGIRTNYSSLRETEFNSGVFKVTLESINSKLADRNSQIRITFFDDTSPGTGPIRIEKAVSVVPGNISITLDKNQYSPFDEARIELVAQSFNVDRNKVDVLEGKVIMSTSSGQSFFPTMTETGTSTGIFVGKVELTADQNEKQGDLLVKGGESIRVSAGIFPGLDVTASARISAPAGSMEFKYGIISVSAPRILTADDTDAVKVGANATIMASITNAKLSEQPFVFIVQVIDARGFTSELSFVVGKIMPEQSMNISHMWIPGARGTYTIRVFVWDTLIQPQVLTPSKNVVIAVN
ncbi:MAG: hypothetical protein HMLIMOIP_002151 [Candidatus Nitrosomirales archaeon]|jgi:hypothetical protein